jgi:type IV pilus assembly protein PilE
MHRGSPGQFPSRGFTLIEVMVTVVIVAILATVAYPSYEQFTFRARVVPGIDALTALATRLEQRFQDVGGYGGGPEGRADGDCGVALPPSANFTLTCVASATGTRFTAKATGTGSVSGVVYAIDDAGVRQTEAHPRGVPASACWSIRGGTCDS